MATPRHLAARNTPRLSSRTLLAVALAGAAAFSTLPTTFSAAEPRPSIEEVAHRVDQLNTQVDVADEDYANSKLALAEAGRKAGVAQGRVKLAQAQLDAVRVSMSAMVAAAYRNGGADQLVSLVNTATPQTFLDRAGALDRIAAGQSAQLAAAQTARHRLAQAQSDAAAAQAAQAAVARTMAAQQTRIEKALAEEQQLLASLRAEERARLEALRRAELARQAEIARQAQLAQERAAQNAARASRSRAISIANAAARAAQRRVTTRSAPAPAHSNPAPSRPAPSSPAPVSPPPVDNGSSAPSHGGAGVAVREAYSQLGKPYRWGASGPGSFDCSGLTAWVWGKAGVSLSHSSQAQRNEGRHVSQSEIQPGDLVFYGSPIHHVGIYVGNGQMISAPHTGDVVKVQAAFRSDYVGATRP